MVDSTPKSFNAYFMSKGNKPAYKQAVLVLSRLRAVLRSSQQNKLEASLT